MHIASIKALTINYLRSKLDVVLMIGNQLGFGAENYWYYCTIWIMHASLSTVKLTPSIKQQYRLPCRRMQNILW
jgi:hypothetical protein